MIALLQGLNSGLLYLPNLAATERLARELAPLLHPGDMIVLQGSLGAGKTTFARALLRIFGITDDVPSPTFTLLQTYETPQLLIVHFDLYRLQSPDELDELGWDDACADSLTLIEWPERAGDRLPPDRLGLHFTLGDSGQRTCQIEAHGAWRERLQEQR